MRLLVDIGNTRLKWAMKQDDAWRDEGALDHIGRDPQQLLAQAWQGLATPTSIWIANVAGPAFAAATAAWAGNAWGLAPVLPMATAQACGVTNAYDDPSRLGIDRWLAMIAAHATQAGDVCIVDCGSALTIDALTAMGQHLGGLIMPGQAMMRQALAGGTAAVNVMAATSDDPATLLATDTAAAVNIGLLQAHSAVIERVVQRLRERHRRDFICLLTGGDALRIMPQLSCESRHAPRLVLAGLHLLAEESS
jgi:type III pantothenate kinase